MTTHTLPSPYRRETSCLQPGFAAPTKTDRQNNPPANRVLRRPWILLLVIMVATASAAPFEAGELDPSFGSRGVVTVDFGLEKFPDDLLRSVAVQADGRIVLAGSVFADLSAPEPHFLSAAAAVRLLPNGRLDRRFGIAGHVFESSTDLGKVTAGVAAISPRRELYLAGAVGTDDPFFGVEPLIMRFNRDGSTDSSYGQGGSATTLPPGIFYDDDWATDISIQPDGKAVIAIASFFELSQLRAARFNRHGSLDASFADEGIAWVRFRKQEVSPEAIEVQDNGRILLAASTHRPGRPPLSFKNAVITIARLHTDGRRDTSFGKNGLLLVPFTPPNEDETSNVHDILALPNGKIVLGGCSENDLVLARLERDGALDSSWGVDGKVVHKIAGFSGCYSSLARQPNGKIVAVGRVSSNGQRHLVVARFTRNGALDADFGEGGIAMPDTSHLGISLACSGFGCIGLDVALQRNYNIIVATTVTRANGHTDFGAIRLFGKESPAQPGS